MRLKLQFGLIFLIGTVANGQAAGPGLEAIHTGVNGSLGGFRPVAVAELSRDVSGDPVDPYTAQFMGIFGGNHLLADFSIPYTVVKGGPTVRMAKIDAADESDLLPVPMSSAVQVEGGVRGCVVDTGDHHGLVIDASTGFDYEVYQVTQCAGRWSAYSVTLWDLTRDEKRPLGWTSSDAAGLPVFPMLVRYDEVAAGAIHHALRVTINHTKTGPKGGIFVPPATHAAGDVWGVSAYTGMRLRLKADYDVSRFSATNQVILKAMKQYGMIVADNGQSGFFQGTADPRWNHDDLGKLRSVPLNAFEIVKMGVQMTADTAPHGASPKISDFKAVKQGASTVLTWNVAGESYSYVEEVGPVRGKTLTVPYAAGATYTLVCTNQFGRSKRSVTAK